MSNERLRRYNEAYRALTPGAQSRDTYNLTELAAIMNLSEKSAFILASLAGAECGDEYDLGLCQSMFEQIKVRALINEGAHPDDVVPMSYPGIDLSELQVRVSERFPDNDAGN